MANLTMIEAITEALDQEMARDEKVYIFGEDVGKTVVFSVRPKVYSTNMAKNV